MSLFERGSRKISINKQVKTHSLTCHCQEICGQAVCCPVRRAVGVSRAARAGIGHPGVGVGGGRAGPACRGGHNDQTTAGSSFCTAPRERDPQTCGENIFC